MLRPGTKELLKTMDDNLQLPVEYRGKELELPLRIIPQGYTYRFVVLVDELEVIFEKDDSGELRALINSPETFTGKMPERDLLEAIAATIQALQS